MTTRLITVSDAIPATDCSFCSTANDRLKRGTTPECHPLRLLACLLIFAIEGFVYAKYSVMSHAVFELHVPALLAALRATELQSPKRSSLELAHIDPYRHASSPLRTTFSRGRLASPSGVSPAAPTRPGATRTHTATAIQPVHDRGGSADRPGACAAGSPGAPLCQVCRPRWTCPPRRRHEPHPPAAAARRRRPLRHRRSVRG